jgi:hypothetical protein
MHVPINVKSLNNTSKWQMGFNSAFKGLKGFGFYVSSILFLKMIRDNRRILYRFNFDFYDAFPSPGFTSEK